ncbi:MAG: DNA internalization-related competence protein ComEC/Rec2 [Anaerolineales bacterium]
MRLVWVAAAWIAGIWLARQAHVPSVVWLAGFGAAVVAAVLARKTRAGLPLLAAAFLLLGGWRYAASLPRIDETHVAWYNERGDVTLVGLVYDEPEPRGTRWRARISAREIIHAYGHAPVRGLVLATLPAYPTVHQGDVVRLRGKLAEPPVWEDFSYRDYLAREGVFSLMTMPSVEVVQQAERRGLRQALSALRMRGEAVIAALIPNPEAGLLTGILLGREGGISADVMDAFRTTGTAHIIAISGFNITVIAGALLKMLTRIVGRRWAVAATISAVALYAVLVGADPPVVRAAIMGCIALVALLLGRRSDALNALAASALLMTAIRPQAIWDVGFQLSFAATLGMILYAEPLHRRVGAFLSAHVPAAWGKVAVGWFGDALATTLAAQVLTLPLTVAYFHNMSPISLIANLLIVPAQPQVMTWGGVGLLLGLIWVPLGMPLAWAAWLFLAYTIRVAEALAAVPGASLEVARVPWPVVVGYYAVAAGLTFGSRRVRRWLGPAARRWAKAVRRWRWQGALAIVAALVWAAGLQMPDGRLHVHFVNVGEGDAVLIRTPRGSAVLIDGGSDPARLLSEVGRRLPFWQRSLALVFLTHPHADHAGGLVGVLERYNVGAFVDARPGKTPEYKACIAAAQARDIPHIQAVPGQRFVVDGDVVLEVLYPSPSTPCRSENECSLVIRLTMGRASFLFTGDLEDEGQVLLMNERDVPQALVLKVPHHGGEKALYPPFLAAVAPRLAVIEGGPRAAADPHPATLQRLQAAGVTVWQTRRKGSLEIATDGQRYWVR